MSEQVGTWLVRRLRRRIERHSCARWSGRHVWNHCGQYDECVRCGYLR